MWKPPEPLGASGSLWSSSVFFVGNDKTGEAERGKKSLFVGRKKGEEVVCPLHLVRFPSTKKVWRRRLLEFLEEG